MIEIPALVRYFVLKQPQHLRIYEIHIFNLHTFIINMNMGGLNVKEDICS